MAIGNSIQVVAVGAQLSKGKRLVGKGLEDERDSETFNAGPVTTCIGARLSRNMESLRADAVLRVLRGQGVTNEDSDERGEAVGRHT